MQKININKEWLKIVFKKIHHYSKAPFWFLVGFSIASLTLISIIIVFFQLSYKEKVIPGIFVDDIYVGEKTQKQVEAIYDKKNLKIKDSKFIFTYNNIGATISAQTLDIGYNSKLIAEQTINLGKSSNLFSNFFLIVNSYLNGTTIHSSYKYQTDILASTLAPLQQEIHINPVDALFTVENNRVSTFKESSDGRDIDMEKVKKFVEERVPSMIQGERKQVFSMEVAVRITKPNITTEEANNFGIVEKIGEGESYFHHSIPNRIHNVTLAASRMNGILVKPNEDFSFNNYLGDVSKYTGYKEAYVIQNGKTVLGDGGGVCQVSSTLFRAVLNAGLPITERHAHAYRVAYYEENSSPGLDATVYGPTVDFRFKNDTSHYILVQTFVDPNTLHLIFTLYGKKDGRETVVTTPVILSTAPAPEPSYQDDPTLPKGVVNQVDFAAPGATVVFNRTVKKDGKVVIDEKYTSRYTPWRAVFLKGTK